MRPPEKIESLRLLMRRPVPEDAQAVYQQYACDSDVTRYLTWPPHKSMEETRKFLRRCKKVWDEGSAFPWSIIRKSDNQLIGMIEVGNLDRTAAMVGFVLAKSHWGRGYIPESLSTVSHWLLENTSLYRVWAVCDVDNKASKRAMQKAGMELEGTLRRWIQLPAFGETPRDCLCFSVVK